MELKVLPNTNQASILIMIILRGVGVEGEVWSLSQHLKHSTLSLFIKLESLQSL